MFGRQVCSKALSFYFANHTYLASAILIKRCSFHFTFRTHCQIKHVYTMEAAKTNTTEEVAPVEKWFSLNWTPPKDPLLNEYWQNIYNLVTSGQHESALQAFRSLKPKYQPLFEASSSFVLMLLLLSYFKAPLDLIDALVYDMKMRNISLDQRCYAALIMANLIHRKYEEVVILLEQMKARGVAPSAFHYTLVFIAYFNIRHSKTYDLLKEILAANFVKPLELYRYMMRFLFRKNDHHKIIDLFHEMKLISQTSHPNYDKGIHFSVSSKSQVPIWSEREVSLIEVLSSTNEQNFQEDRQSLTPSSSSTLPKLTFLASYPIPDMDIHGMILKVLTVLRRYRDVVNLWKDVRKMQWYPFDVSISQHILNALVETKNYTVTFVLLLDLCGHNIPIDQHFFRSFLYWTFGIHSPIKPKLPNSLQKQVDEWQRYVEQNLTTRGKGEGEPIESEIQARLSVFCVACLQSLLAATHKNSGPI
jgi:hypothetical protein